MALQYISVPVQDIGAGIDQLSAENRVPEGYSESLVNWDPQPEGSLKKRSGYQGYGGFLPIRVDKLEYTTDATDNVCFFLDSSVDISSIDLSSTRSTPLVVYGRTSESHATGDWDDTDNAHYYPGFTADARRTFLTGSNVLSIPGSEHGQGDLLFVGLTESTSLTDNSNSQFMPDEIEVTQSTDDLDISYNNGTGFTFPGYVYFKDKSAEGGVTYNSAPIAHPSGVTTTTTISAGVHGLSNFNILVKGYEDTGSIYREILPDNVTIATNGSVSIDIFNGTGSSINIVFILTAVDVSNFATGTVGSGASASVVISNIETDFLFIGCYLEQTLGGTKEMVIPDSIVVDSIARTATVSFVNGTLSSASFFVYYEYATVATNKLCVDGAVIGVGYTDENVQLSIWGLDHRIIYGNNTTSSRPGWVTHIDSYRSAGENKLISGLGGNLFEAGPFIDFSGGYLYAALYPNIRERISTDTVIGPAFYDNTDTPSRSRGFIKFDGGGEGFAKGTAVTWVSGNTVKYTLSCPNLAVSGVLGTIISNTSNLEDYLTVEQAGYSINEGTFKIVSVTNPSLDVIEIIVENTARNSADYDETDTWMDCGVFTDRLPLLSTSPFIPDDTLRSDIFGEDTILTVTSASGSTVVFNGVTEEIEVPSGLRIVGERTSNIVPLRELDDTPSVENLVQGDLLTYTPIVRELRVKYINVNADISITIDGDGSSAMVTMMSGSTAGFWIGQDILIKQGGVYSGYHTITDIESETEFFFDSEETAVSVSGILQGKCIQIDESTEIIDTVGSNNSMSVPKRWIPIEAPDDSWSLTPNTYYRHLDSNSYGDQATLRSVMVADNLYVTNGDDEVFKYDGTNIYRAGIFRWQPHLFVVTDSAPPAPETGEIVINLPSTTPSAITNNEFTVPIGDELKFTVGQTVRHGYTGGFDDFIITGIRDDGTNGFIAVQAFKVIVLGAAPTLKGVGIYHYYFRLNAIDANQNIIASAVTGAEDFVVQLADTAQVRLRLMGFPSWDAYDYDRLEVEIYRTKLNGVAPYFKLATIPISFDLATGYLDYIDTDSDDILKDFDIVNTALLGPELGQTWSEPLRGKYITSAGNRLVLGNIKDYPKLDVQLLDTGVRITASVLNSQIYTFRKDNTDSGTTSDMSGRVRYEFRNTGAISMTPNTDIVNNAGASFTITSVGHGLVAGDWVYLFHSAVEDGNRLTYAGWWQVFSVTATQFTITYPHSTSYVPAAQDVDRFLKASTSKDVPVWLGTDGNYASVNGNSITTFAYEFIAMRRLANAINSSMRMVDTSLSGYENFEPWIVANAGSEFNFGQLVVSQPKVFNTFLELQLPTYSGYNTFVNGVLRSSGAQVSATINVFPSRIIASYPNYPEVMDNPTSILDTDSDSAIDVNPADGQDITGIIPFFGDSAFGAAQKDSVVVVFKTNSIYLVNLAAKAQGINPVQKLESRGLGCTAPFSIAPTQGGIMFANESGIYRLSRDLSIDYIGRKISRIWTDSVDKDKLDDMTGHYYPLLNLYKLSLPYLEDTDGNDKVAVYNTVREYAADGFRMGSWTTYDNHPTTGWANLQTDAFFSSTLGEVFTLRQTGLKYDSRDDSTAISAEGILRAMDFGDPAIRKAVLSATLQFRNNGITTGTTVSAAANLTDDFDELDSFQLVSNSEELSGIGDDSTKKIETIRFTVDRRKCQYIQLKVANGAIDEPVEVTGITYRVAGLTDTGTTQARETITNNE